MSRSWLFGSLPVLILAAVVACGADDKDDDDDDDDDGGDDTAVVTDDTGASGDDTGGGDDTGVAEPAPDISVSPASVDFGTVSVTGDPVWEAVTVTNAGTSDLTLSDLWLEEAGAAFELGPVSTVLLAPGESASFEIGFTPAEGTSYTDTVVLESNDPDEPSVSIDVVGIGGAGAVRLTPSDFDFGTVYIGCEAEQTVTIANEGTADLVVSDLEWNTGSTDLEFDDRASTNGSLPWTLAPGGSVEVAVTYVPFDEYADIAYLFVESDDPYTPQVLATFEATGELYGSNSDAYEQALPGTTDTFALTAQPVPETIEVRIDGITVTVGWSYDAASNAVVFATDHVPEGGSTIEISYALTGCAR